MLDQITSWIAALLTAVIPGYGVDPTPVYNGYVEGEFVHVAPSVTGRLNTMAVSEGDIVVAGQFLFDMDSTKQRAALRAANFRVAQAEANLRNLETGSREAEIEVIRASLAEARAARDLARTTLERTENLFRNNIVTEAKVEADRTALQQAEAHVSQLEAQLKVAELPARDEQLIAAQATLKAAQAEADLAAAQLDDMHVTAPTQGLVEKVYFEAGEVAAAGTPVVSILPPDALHVLFYLPEQERPDFSIGEVLDLSCDGCPPGLTATITRMASEPQFTPPIIYSREQRTRLVYRAEASLPRDSGLLPGQPVTLERRK
ncbi:MAG: HlyD family secretion protein [Alphaproteobacteria bacterium]|nr:MAG: HlyD family secretion protein [Alphaproteobacteria bacterium]